MLTGIDKLEVEAVFRKTSKFLSVSTDFIFYLPRDFNLIDEENGRIKNNGVLKDIQNILEFQSPTIEILESAMEIDTQNYSSFISSTYYFF